MPLPISPRLSLGQHTRGWLKLLSRDVPVFGITDRQIHDNAPLLHALEMWLDS